MLMDRGVAPKCDCGGTDWKLENSHTLLEKSGFEFRCMDCGRPAFVVLTGVAQVVFVSTSPAEKFPESVIKWVNQTVLPFWQKSLNDYREQKAVEVRNKALDHFGIAHGVCSSSMDKQHADYVEGEVEAFVQSKNWHSPKGFKAGLPASVPEGINVFTLNHEGVWEIAYMSVCSQTEQEKSSRLQLGVLVTAQA